MSGEPNGPTARVGSHFTYGEKKLVTALDGPPVPLPEDFALHDLTGR